MSCRRIIPKSRLAPTVVAARAQVTSRPRRLTPDVRTKTTPSRLPASKTTKVTAGTPPRLATWITGSASIWLYAMLPALPWGETWIRSVSIAAQVTGTARTAGRSCSLSANETVRRIALDQPTATRVRIRSAAIQPPTVRWYGKLLIPPIAPASKVSRRRDAVGARDVATITGAGASHAAHHMGCMA